MWSAKPRMTAADTVTDGLRMARFRRKPAQGLIHHSDRVGQYASLAFQSTPGDYGMLCSMSRSGNCWDNAPRESFSNSLKNERVHCAYYATRDEATADLFDWIETFYNRRRRRSALGHHSSVQSLRNVITNQHEKMAAGSCSLVRRKTEGSAIALDRS